MATLTDHIIKLTEHRDRSLLELTLAKALIDLLPIDRVVISRVQAQEGERRWLDVAVLDARGGGKVTDPLHVLFTDLHLLDDFKDRLSCLERNARVDVAWAGPQGPCISYFPLFLDGRDEEQGVVEIHVGKPLAGDNLLVWDTLHRVYINMYRLLAYSDRDPLTGLLNRKSLNDTFYSAVLDELGESMTLAQRREVGPVSGHERRHRVPPNYWLGGIVVDDWMPLGEQHGALVMEEVLLLLARIMNTTFRTYDRLYRLGGGEFAVLMHCPDENLVLAAFERFRANMERFNFPQVGKVTTCAGFTRVSPEDSPHTALDRVKRVVQYGQGEGGNRVLSFSDLVRRGILAEALPKPRLDVLW